MFFGNIKQEYMEKYKNLKKKYEKVKKFFSRFCIEGNQCKQDVVIRREMA